MKLFILERNPEEVYWDETSGCIIRATSHKAARKIAYNNIRGDQSNKVWLDTKRSSCKEIKQEGKPEILIIDFNAG